MRSRGARARVEFELHDLHPEPADFRGEVLAGLERSPKTLPCKYFYDERGSQLFDRICELEEYYPTRTEIGILERHAGAIAAHLGERPLILELGSGSSTKTHILLRALPDAAGYVPVDIARDHLLTAARRVADAFPAFPVWPVCADFSREFDLPPALPSGPRYVFFPGSTIGNFDRAGRRALLRRLVRLCRPEGGGLLVGIDLKKDRQLLEAAYNDSQGVTSAFNLNLLRRINRELGVNFDEARFRHRAFYNETEGCIEMHLVSETHQIVSIGSRAIRLVRGESICTEHSYKFSVQEFAAEAKESGLALDAAWSDDEDLFAVLLLVTDGVA